MKDARYWIENLDLIEHPEGGFYRETYRSKESIARQGLPERFGGDRTFSTAIFFLLPGNDFSAFHRIKQDEVWHFYEGSALTIHMIDPNGRYWTKKLGRRVEEDEVLQTVVEAGFCFGAAVDDTNSYSLVGCTVAPGFEFADFEMPSRDELLERYPQHREIIVKLTR